MSYISKTWEDRISEYPNRRTLTKEDNTTEIVLVERNEGLISKEGNAFSAEEMNDLEARIANEFASLKAVTTVTLAPGSAWLAMTGGYYQEVSAPGYLVGDNPIATFVPATFPFPTTAESTALSYVGNKKCVNAGKVTFYATSQPAVTLKYALKGV